MEAAAGGATARPTPIRIGGAVKAEARATRQSAISERIGLEGKERVVGLRSTSRFPEG